LSHESHNALFQESFLQDLQYIQTLTLSFGIFGTLAPFEFIITKVSKQNQFGSFSGRDPMP
jgi:hypothetical protein